MVPKAEATAFVSYTDGTSLPRVGCKVSIQAQVLRDEPMPWFRVIAQRIPDHWGEPKSIPGVNVYFNLPDRERRSVLATLRKVRIHITDPRPYYDSVQDALKPMLGPGMSVQDFIARHDKQPHVRNIQKIVRHHITEEIVLDSPAERLKRQNQILDVLSGRRIAGWLPIPRELEGMITPKVQRAFDPSVFEKRASNMVNQAAVAVAKSASVFSEALEMATDATSAPPAVSRALSAMSILASLSADRAFDKGEPDSLAFVREQLDQVLSESDPFPWVRRKKGVLEEVDSVDHREIQAADIAGGIAGALWKREGLVSVVRHFDYVLLNGMRLSETTAAAHPYSHPPLL